MSDESKKPEAVKDGLTFFPVPEFSSVEVALALMKNAISVAQTYLTCLRYIQKWLRIYFSAAAMFLRFHRLLIVQKQ